MSDLNAALAELDAALAEDDARFARLWPGTSDHRQPVHTVYIPADRLDRNTVCSWGEEAAELLSEHGADAGRLAATFGLGSRDSGAVGSGSLETGASSLDTNLVEELRTRVLDKLRRQPIEDLRIDFEDGFAPRSDAEEGACVDRAAEELLALLEQGAGSPFRFGIRFKSFEAATRARGARTLLRWLDRLAGTHAAAQGVLVTLPKVTSVEQVAAMARLCQRIEDSHGDALGPIRFELQIEMPQAVLGADGRALIAPMIHAGSGRVSGLHFGTYDYTAECGIAASEQALDHPAADHAKTIMQLAAAGTGVELSDGSTQIVPVGTAEDVHAAWATHARLIRHSLSCGYAQGWDLHPGHLVSRLMTVFAHHRAGWAEAAERLRCYRVQIGAIDDPDGAAGAGAGRMEEPATARALAGQLLRGLDCGALGAEEIRAACGAGPEELRALRSRTGTRGPENPSGTGASGAGAPGPRRPGGGVPCGRSES